jgi:hypothetical protein
MKEMGVRFNDYGTFFRGNRFYKQSVSSETRAA